ncbi:hypothetical protein PBI_BRIDGETTE_49 [Arthrobacter phage Bridgette]|uniref:Uncharacterized protein n=1 Tax=Arthrobacter phage Bridgette TaxID=2419949 RepID=A0A3G2KEI1_9CAUD|nr:hypothetical protein HOU46_gp49 [Arthrobacter phage Bridgette]AYN57315.1 hypothetical protein PBI_BRIDGETTE_49 [Arthrobacter phage Bridgette]
MSNGLDAFKKRAPSKFATFPQPGATVAGVITEISDQKQATKYNRDPKAPKELEFWPKSGDPKMEVWVTLQTNERDPLDPEDRGLRTVVVTVNQKPGGQLAAIMDACEAIGAETPLPGGFLVLTFTGYDPESENAQQPRKLFAAQYKSPAPGGGAFTPQAAPAVQQAPQEQYNQWNPAPPAPIQQQAPVQQYQQPPVQQQAAPPAWAQPPVQQAPQQQYQPPVQVNTSTGEVAPQQGYQQPAQQAPVQQYQQPPVQQQAPQQGGGVDASQIQALIAQGMDDATIQSTTGAPAPAIAAIRAVS